MQSSMTQPCETALLEQRIAELERENERLRASAKSFGELAERLNARLRKVETRQTFRAKENDAQFQAWAQL